MRDRVPVIDRDGVAAVPFAYADEAVSGAIQRLVPGGLAPAGALTNQGSSDAIGILVNIREGRRFGTDIPAAERILVVAADRADAPGVRVDQDAARRLAQRAGRGSHHQAILRANTQARAKPEHDLRGVPAGLPIAARSTMRKLLQTLAISTVPARFRLGRQCADLFWHSHWRAASAARVPRAAPTRPRLYVG